MYMLLSLFLLLFDVLIVSALAFLVADNPDA
jgi:hypothetical protein